MRMTDTEFGLAIGFKNAIRKQDEQHANDINQMASHIQMLTAELEKSRAELREERGKRRLLQLQIERILDTPV